MTEITEKPLRDAKGRMLAPLPGRVPITSANARFLVNKRWEKYRLAAVKRIVGEASSIDMSVSTGADAFALVASKQYLALMDSDKPKIVDLEKLGNIMTGASAEKSQLDHTPPNGGLGLQVNITAAALLEIANAIEEHRRHDRDASRAIIEATIQE